MLTVSRNVNVIRELKEKQNREFEIKDLGKASKILSINIIRER